jgi:hypothetical protein
VGEIAGIAVYLSLLVDPLLERKTGSGLLGNFWVSVLSFSASAASGYAVHEMIGPRGWFGLLEFGVAWAIPAAVAVYWLFLSRPRRARVMAAATGLVRSRRAKSRMKNANPAELG